MTESAELARRLGLTLHTHLAETVEEEAYCMELYGATPVEYLTDLGWLGQDVWCAHCVHLSADDMADFAASDTGVAHCPTSNLRLGAGVAPVREYLDAGIRVGLGVDGSASNERSDLLDEVKQALLVARGRGGPAALTAREALRLGTRGGASLLGRDDIGSLEPGKRADFAVWRTDGLELGGRRRPGRRPRLLGAASGRPARRRGRGRRPRRGPRQRRRGRDRTCPAGAGAKIRAMSVSVSTHVLDTGAGRPAAGVRVELVRGIATSWPPARPTTTDGSPSWQRGSSPGRYALVFWPPSPFFTRVELEVDLVDGHYHVPLLVSPYGCASYRGS